MKLRNSLLLAAVCAVALACGSTSSETPEGGDTSGGGGLGLGDTCQDTSECGPGLACSGVDGTCQPEGAPGTTPENGGCGTNQECQNGLVCANDGTCQMPGAPGTTAAGGACEGDEDCQLFLSCLDDVCQGIQPPFWIGTDCSQPDDNATPLKVYFEVNGDSGEFYRLPFPNDINNAGGHIDLDDHANPGIIIEELGNPVQDYFDMIEADVGGWGTQSCAFFRFNRWPDADSLMQEGARYIVDITPESDKYGEVKSRAFRARSDRAQYICWNWLSMCPLPGNPMYPDTTYAFVLTTEITDANGVAVEQDEDFAALLEATPPADASLSSAWQAYQPFRDYLEDHDIDPDTIAAAAVVTTGRPEATVPKVREGVRTEAAPTVSGVTETAQSAYTLYSGTLTVPFYQNGTRPFRSVAEGGAIAYDEDGLPVLVETEDVRFAITVPLGAAPENGWPVFLYAHGTGGSEMSFVNNEVADEMAAVGAAVIGVEQVQHGDRRGLPEAEAALESNSPEYLFYNFINPRAARDNNVQAAADLFQLARLVEDCPIGDLDVEFDLDRVYFFGHSQGTQGPFLAAVHEPRIQGIVLSGAGGYLIDSLLGKTEPFDVSTAIKLALIDPTVDQYHPLLNLVQLAFDSVDPVNFVRTAYIDGVDLGYPRRHFFMSYGVGDHYTPEPTQEALAKVSRAWQWIDPSTGEDPISGVPEIEELPHEYSWDYGGGLVVNAVVVKYAPDGDYDGHFVMFNHPDAIFQYTEWVREMIENGIPVLYDAP